LEGSPCTQGGTGTTKNLKLKDEEGKARRECQILLRGKEKKVAPVLMGLKIRAKQVAERGEGPTNQLLLQKNMESRGLQMGVRNRDQESRCSHSGEKKGRRGGLPEGQLFPRKFFVKGFFTGISEKNPRCGGDMWEGRNDGGGSWVEQVVGGNPFRLIRR